jgi:AcrR family transcriptional regulator
MSGCLDYGIVYSIRMPRLWTETVEEHRHAVREATMRATVDLVAEQGLRGVTMSQIAERSGIGRATLYKYFPDVEAILLAWHERQVDGHLQQLAEIRDRGDSPWDRLELALETYAEIERKSRRHRDGELAALLHRGEHIQGARKRLTDLITDLIVDAARTGRARDDTPPGELASYCLHALSAASELSSKAASRRLVKLTLDGLGRHQ